MNEPQIKKINELTDRELENAFLQQSYNFEAGKNMLSILFQEIANRQRLKAENAPKELPIVLPKLNKLPKEEIGKFE